MPLIEKLEKLESFSNNIKNTTPLTLETMIKYLDIPSDMPKFNERLKYL